MSLTFGFALLKLQHLLEFKNPSISTFDQEIDTSEENSFSLSSDSFMLAFGIERIKDDDVKMINDERYV